MDTPTPAAQEVDLHRLDLRFDQVRVLDPRAVEQLARSIEQSGQLIACVAVPEDGSQRLILVDGYRRVAALRRLRRDTAWVECWACDLTQALLSLLARAHGRPFAALEEALLLRELVHSQGLSQHEVARRTGRDVSWVSRRLQLVCALPDSVLVAVRNGSVSTWAATRVLAPLARANTAHAAQLLGALDSTPLSTRELERWFQHYQSSARATRERLVAHPHLFLQSLHARDEQRADKQLRDGLEGRCAADVAQLLRLITQLHERLPQLNAQGLPEPLLMALTRLHSAIEALECDLRRYCDHDPQRDLQQRAHPASPGPQRARDQPAAQALA
jgi:ParB family transcriptional regulator, chromosome partitioning protein